MPMFQMQQLRPKGAPSYVGVPQLARGQTRIGATGAHQKASQVWQECTACAERGGSGSGGGRPRGGSCSGPVRSQQPERSPQMPTPASQASYLGLVIHYTEPIRRHPQDRLYGLPAHLGEGVRQRVTGSQVRAAWSHPPVSGALPRRPSLPLSLTHGLQPLHCFLTHVHPTRLLHLHVAQVLGAGNRGCEARTVAGQPSMHWAWLHLSTSHTPRFYRVGT